MSSINDRNKKNKNKPSNPKIAFSDQKINVNIKIKDGLKKQIEIDSNSNYGDIAFEFCKKNNLDYKTLISLKSNLENIIKNPSNGNNIFDISLDKELYLNISQRINDNNFQKNNNNDIKENNNNKEGQKIINQKHNIPIKKNQKLFPYEFKIKSNFKKKKIKTLKNNNDRNLNEKNNNIPHNKISNRINTSTNINISSIEKDSTFNLNKSGTLKPMNTISNFSMIQSKNFNSNNIFERLFNDAEIKRITYRRPCHFSSNLRNKTLVNNNNNSISNNYNSFNLTNLTIFSNNSNKNDKERNYNNSYIYKSLKSLGNNNILQPKIILRRSKSSNKKSYKRNNYILNNKNNGYKPFTIKEEENNSYNDTDNNKTNNDNNKKNNGKVKFNTINSINEIKKEKEKKTPNNKHIYHPLKDKMIWGSQDGDILLEGIRTEAFSNLFNELNGHNKTKELNEKNIIIEKIPTMVLYDIEPITSEIYKHKKSYSLNDFINEMKEIFNQLPMEDKRNIISLYKNSNNPITINNSYYLSTQNNNKKKNNNLFNTKQLSHMNSSRGINKNSPYYQNSNHKTQFNYSDKKKPNSSISHEKLLSNTERKRNFFYVN